MKSKNPWANRVYNICLKPWPVPSWIRGWTFAQQPAIVLSVWIAVLFFTPTQALSETTANTSSLWVGAAQVDVTPNYPIRLSGYGSRTRESEGVRQTLWGKAIAFSSGTSNAPGTGLAVLVTLDTTGVSQAFTDAVWERVAAQIPLARDQFALTCTHSHTAPMLKDVLPNLFSTPISDEEQTRIDRYTQELEGYLVEAILAAVKNRVPCRVVWGVGRAGFAMNRRTTGGPVDHSLPVLAAYDLQGQLRAVLTSYACHCTTLGGGHNQHCGDWAGFAQAFLEARLPGAVALVSIGCGADSNPSPRGNMAHAVQHGQEIADAVEAVLAKDELRPLIQAPKGQRHTLQLPFEPLPTRSEWEDRAQVDGITGFHARKNLERLDRNEALPTELSYTLQTWAFDDDLAMVFLPGEVVVDYALRLKRELNSDRLWVHGYANEVRGYIPSERILKEGGYEGGSAMPYYDLPARFAPGLEDRIIGSVRALLSESYHASEKPVDTTGAPFPVEPEASLALIHTHDDLKVELVVAEPLVIDPVALDFGSDGRLWVVEMRDYPSGTDGNWKPGGQIKVLSDTNGDGSYDTSTVFLDALPFPTGVMVYHEGILVCAAPDILYAVDTNGDGVADRVEKWLTGFAVENYQARVNGLSLGLDNWIYGANGLLGGVIQGRFGESSVDIRGRDFRFHPELGRFEAESGLSQQGRVRTDWGDWIGSDNGTPGWHYPIADRYLRRNPWVNVAAQRAYLSEGIQPNRVWPVSQLLERFNDPGHANQVTSGCGHDIYRDQTLGARFAGDFFLCEPVHNLVLRRKLHWQGGTLRGHRAEDEGEQDFLASQDNWFRPVQVKTGPDGALWVVDMYRYVIEHPRWISPSRLAELNVRAGDDRGRIYRVTKKSDMTSAVPIDLTRLPLSEVVRRLDTVHGAERDRIRQWLLHQTPSTEALTWVARLVAEAQHPETRAQAMSVLAAWDSLSRETISSALRDPHPGVRRLGLRWAETQWVNAPDLVSDMVRLADDALVEVRFQAALSLGAVRHPTASQALTKLVLSDGTDPWFRSAILSSSVAAASNLFLGVLNGAGTTSLSDAALGEFLEGWIQTATGEKNRAGLQAMSEALGHSLLNDTHVNTRQHTRWKAWQIRALGALTDASASMDEEDGSEGGFLVADQTHWQQDVLQLALAADSAEEQAVGVATLQALARSSSVDRATIRQVIDWLHTSALADGSELEHAALKFLSTQNLMETGSWLLERWTEVGPGRRARWLGLLLSRPGWSVALIEAMESGQVAATEVAGWQRDRLRQHAEMAGWLARVDALLGRPTQEGRDLVVAKYQAVNTQIGRADSGRLLFQEHCASCHAFRGDGIALGPDLGLFRDKDIPDFLEAILDPNAVIEPRYVTYAVETKDGRSLTGVLSDETAAGLTVVQAGGLRESLRRADILSVQAIETSLMPEGFEAVMDHQAMADLISYVKSGQSLSIGSSAREQAVVGSDQDLPKAETSISPSKISRTGWVTDILDDGQPEAQRMAWLQAKSDRTPALILEMSADLEPQQSPGGTEEYRRIPWIWRAAIAAGRRNDTDELRRVLGVSLPRVDQPLLDWQAVVVGGGVINGISLEGHWPKARIQEMLEGETVLLRRWNHALTCSLAMADDETVPTGTRYDALRMIALMDENIALDIFERYLEKDTHPELQQGAVSGLGDIPSDRAKTLLRSSLPNLTESNRRLAEAALVRQ